MSLGEKATAEDEKLVKGLFEAVGKIWTAKEKLLDVITGLSGSGPAYRYLAIEALANGGVAAGLPRELASSLAPQTVVEECEVIVLGVKPQVVKEVLIDLKPILSDDKLLVSIAEGVKLKDLEEWAGKARVVRVIPNTPCLVGESAAVMSLGDKATAEDEKLVKGLFEAVGKIWTAKEMLLDAVTGLSGSGPAYIYLAIEALADGGVAAGLPRELASSLAPQTVLGAAKMVMDTKKSPGQLKDEAVSPAGITIAGIHELEKGGFRGTLMSSVIAAAKKSEELSKT